MTQKIFFRRLLMLAALAGLVLSPLVAYASDDDGVPSQFKYDQGDDNGRGNGNQGGNDGGLNADPNDWDVDSWGRATIEPVPAPNPPEVVHVTFVDRWAGWMRSLINAFLVKRDIARH